MKGSFSSSPQDYSQHLGVCPLVRPTFFSSPKELLSSQDRSCPEDFFFFHVPDWFSSPEELSQDCSFAGEANRSSQLPTIVEQLFLPQESFSPPEELLSPQDLLSMRSLILLDSPCRKNHSCCLEIARSQKKSPGGTAAAYACGGTFLAPGIGFLF